MWVDMMAEDLLAAVRNKEDITQHTTDRTIADLNNDIICYTI